MNKSAKGASNVAPPAVRSNGSGADRFGAMWRAAAIALLTIAYVRFFDGTSFTQDDYVWLCFSKYYPAPMAIFGRDSLCQQFFRPMGQAWWLVMHALGGSKLWVYQVGFLATHLLNAYLVARLTTGLADAAIGRRAALFFALSPLFVAAISIHYLYIFDVLGCTYFLLALLAIRYAVEQRRLWILWVLSLSAFAAMAAYLSKEAYFTLPGAVALAVGVDGQKRWNWSTLIARRYWIGLHVIVLAAAVVWRTLVIHGFGGYDLAVVHDLKHFGLHVIQRICTWFGLGGWTLAPVLAYWSPEEHWQVGVSALVFAGVTALAVAERRFRHLVAWSWCWMAMMWAPSVVMRTHAPVSWYVCSVGSALLASIALNRVSRAGVVDLILGVVLSVNAFLYYHDNAAYVRQLRREQQVLVERFPKGGAMSPPGTRYILFNCSFDLYPDPVVKLTTPAGTPMADVLFLNAEAPVAWIITNADNHQDLWPMRAHEMFQRGYMDMIQYRAVPLQFQDRREAIVRAGPPFRFLRWVDGDLVDITEEIRSRVADLTP